MDYLTDKISRSSEAKRGKQNSKNGRVAVDSQLPASEWAHHAGRIMIEEGMIDYAFAKQKAAKQMGGNTSAQQPSNADVEAAAQNYYQLYKSVEEDRWHLDQLEFARDSLKALSAFTPSIAGTLLKGRPNALDEVEIHAFADTAEEVMEALLEFTGEVEPDEKAIRFAGEANRCLLPMFRCGLGEFTALVVVFDESVEKLTPLSSADSKPLQRWREAELSAEIAGIKLVLTKSC